MEIIRAKVEDLDAIRTIDEDCFAEPWSKGALLATLDSEHSRYYIAKVAGQAVAYIGYYNTGDILNVATLTEFRGRGIATKLIQHAINTAKEENIERLMLEVREGNLTAIKLYTNAGFELVTKRLRYYHDQQTALIYAKQLV